MGGQRRSHPRWSSAPPPMPKTLEAVFPTFAAAVFPEQHRLALVKLITIVIFGTINGVIGIIASLSHDQDVFLEKLQSTLVKFIKGVGSLSHEQWQSFHNDKKTAEARNFLDSDLIESFLDLNRSKMEEVSKAIGVSVEELSKRVEELTRLH